MLQRRALRYGLDNRCREVHDPRSCSNNTCVFVLPIFGTDSVSKTARACSSVPDGIFGTARSCGLPLLVTITGSWSPSDPVISGISFPSKWMIRGNSGWKLSLRLLAVTSRCYWRFRLILVLVQCVHQNFSLFPQQSLEQLGQIFYYNLRLLKNLELWSSAVDFFLLDLTCQKGLGHQ